jgi:hypothetical protein
MSPFGTGGLFVFFVVGAIFAAAEVGWPVVFGLFALIVGYFCFLNSLNSTIRPDGSLRSRQERRRRGSRW